ncbi:MAG: caspase family protein [Thermodesulfobacteriota bacterium]
MSAKLRITILFLSLFLSSCMWGATTVPEIYLRQSDLTMELNREAFGLESLAVSRDGKYLLTGDNGGWSMMSGGYGTGRSSLRLWDLAQGKLIAKMNASGTIISVALSPDNKYAVTGGITRGGFPPLNVWDLATGSLYKTYGRLSGFQGNEFNSISFSPDGKYFLVTDWTRIYIFNAKTWNLIKTLAPAGYSPPAVPPYKSFIAAFSPDGRHVLSGGPDAVLRLWDLDTGQEVKQFLGHNPGWLHGGISSIEFSPDGKHAITNAYNDGNVILWDIEKGMEVKRFSGFESLLGMYFCDKTLTFSPDGKFVFIVGDKIWDINTGTAVVDLTYAWRGIKTAGRNPASGQYHPNGKHVLMTMNDAAVRIYDVKTGEEIAMMVGFDDGEWLVITTEGYYNTSEKGAEYLSVKEGEKKYEMNLFYDVFYRPDIVTAKLRGEDIRDLITITMKDAIKNPPPAIEFTTVPTESASSKVEVCYQAKSMGGGIGEVRLFHNGKLIESDGYYKEAARIDAEKTQLAKLDSRAIYDEMRSIKVNEKGVETGAAIGKPKGEVFNDCKQIEVVSGENEISVAAFNRDNTVQGNMKTAKFFAKIQPEEPHLYILSIGVDRYKDGTINLKYPVKDAKDITEKILNQAATLYNPRNIHYEILTDDQATKANITGRIDELAKRIRPSDSFILFAAGHGVLLQNQYYMLTSEYEGKVNSHHLISSNEIVEISKKIKSLSQLFMFDTCHAGGVDTIVSGLYDARISVLAKKMGLHIYASANSKEAALDGYQGNGLFTYTLLDGLNNKREADRNYDNKISLVELGEYTKQATAEISRRIGHQQTPLIINFGKDSSVYSLR